MICNNLFSLALNKKNVEKITKHLAPIFWSKQKIQSNGRGLLVQYEKFDHFAEVVKPSNQLKDRETEVNKAKSMSGSWHSLQIVKKSSSGHP